MILPAVCPIYYPPIIIYNKYSSTPDKYANYTNNERKANSKSGAASCLHIASERLPLHKLSGIWRWIWYMRK